MDVGVIQRSGLTTGRRSLLLAGAATLCASALLAYAASSARATDEHLFDPVLSLTGDCAVSEGDPVADPGCPGNPEKHPPKKFASPCGTVTDSHGFIYVASQGEVLAGGRIDVFNAKGEFVLEFKDEHQPCGIAVDGKGNLYVSEFDGGKVVLYEPDSYPITATTKYGSPVVIHKPNPGFCLERGEGVAVDPSNDHVYVAVGCRIDEYDSAANGSAPLKEGIGEGQAENIKGVDVWGKNHDVYASGVKFGAEDRADPKNARAFVFDGGDGHVKCELSGPEGGFGFKWGSAAVAVDQANGDVYVGDTATHHVVDQFSIDGDVCSTVGKLEHQLTSLEIPPADIAVDAPLEGQVGYLSPNPGYVYVTAGATSPKSHLYAFKPKIVGPPEVRGQTAVGIGESEAVLRAEVNPQGLPTAYRFEYTSEADFKASGYANATSVPVPDGEAGAGGSFLIVQEQITGLESGVTYRFRLVASNEECATTGEDEPEEGCKEGKDARFSTYPFQAVAGGCPNEGLRSGPSARLPECRAYELVTPADTNGRLPTMSEFGYINKGDSFSTALTSADGDSLVFGTEGGSLPGVGGGGLHDTYEARRGQGGWQSHVTSPSGAQAERAYPGGISADHGYSLWLVVEGNGSLAPAPGAFEAQYLRRSQGAVDPACAPPSEPEGRFEFIGCGSLGVDTNASGRWISAGGGHVVFITGDKDTLAVGKAVQLEPDAPPSGTGAIYDRTPGGATHVVSLLPGEAAPSADADYQGTSADGSVVAFKLSEGGTTTMYARIDNAETVAVASGEIAFGGLSRDGTRLFYLQINPSEPLLKDTQIPQGKLFACDIRSGPCTGPGAQAPTQIGSGEKSIFVNVSADGSHAYFFSPEQLDGGQGEVGGDNLYAWDGTSIRFIATLTHADLVGEPANPSINAAFGGLGLWTTGPASPTKDRYRGPGTDPSRTTPDGSVLVFQSHANLTGYDSGGHSEVYRYDASAEAGEQLSCVSCDPTGAPAESDAQLQSNPGNQFIPFPPVNALAQIDNVTADGQAVFFQSADRLVPGDVDHKIDVYEWEAQGREACETDGGCLHLISFGQSAGDDYLYATTPDGHDVFFQSSDLLTPQDSDGTPSIYDARVGGGFAASAVQEPCQAVEGCRSKAPFAPALPSGPTGPFAADAHPHHCPKGKRALHRGGKLRCVGRHKHRKRKHRHVHRGQKSGRALR